MSAHTPGPWFVFNMVHEKNGRPLTPEELGEYVTNNIRKSIEDGGSATRFLFVTQAGAGVPDICHVGNGPAGPANAHLIASAPELYEALERARLDYVNMLENARDRIIERGGCCDPVDVMERGDPALRRIDAALSKAKGEKK